MLLNFLHADLTAEDGSDSEISSLSWIRRSHHVLRIKHLLSQLRNTKGTELVASTRCQGSEADHEEVQTRERNHVDSEFSKIRVELTGESETGGDARHDSRDEVVEISVRRSIEFKGTDADIVQGFIVNAESLVRVLDKLLRVNMVLIRDLRGRREWRCKAQQRYQTPLAMERRRMWPSFDRGILREFC